MCRRCFCCLRNPTNLSIVSPSVNSPSKYLVGRTGDTDAMIVAVSFSDVISFGEREIGSGVLLSFW